MIVPDGIEPITAYRIWGVTGADARHRLQSTAAGFCLDRMPEWPTFVRFDAACLGPRACPQTEVPVLEHGCGIHAFKDMDAALAWAASMRHRDVVVGVVALWGKVIETEIGYRARFAYPVSLVNTVPRRRARSVLPDLGALRDAYGLTDTTFEPSGAAATSV